MKIVGETISIYDTDGKLLHVEDVISYTKQNVMKNYASLQHFIRHWKENQKQNRDPGCLSEAEHRPEGTEKKPKHGRCG